MSNAYDVMAFMAVSIISYDKLLDFTKTRYKNKGLLDPEVRNSPGDVVEQSFTSRLRFMTFSTRVFFKTAWLLKPKVMVE